MFSTELQASATAHWADIRTALPHSEKGWKLKELYRREDPGIARTVLLARHADGTCYTFKHALREWNPESFQAQYDRHVAAYEAFPNSNEIAISRPRFCDASRQCAVFDHANGLNLRDQMLLLVDDPEAQLALVKRAGQWLQAYHQSRGVERREFNTKWAIDRYGRIRDGLENGSFNTPARQIFFDAILMIEQLGFEFEGQQTCASTQHGDFHMGNLIWDGSCMTGIDISAGHVAPVGHDVNKFLIDYTRRFWRARDVRPGNCYPRAVRKAFFEGYKLVGVNDPGVRQLAYAQMIETLMLVPKKQEDRTKAKQLCLQQLRPIAKKALQPASQAGTGRELRFLLTKRTVEKARKNRHQFIRQITEVARQAGLMPTYRINAKGTRAKATQDGAFTMFHMAEPIDERSLCYRKVYAEPFWQIESVGARWHWQVAREAFKPSAVDTALAEPFYDHWRSELFGDAAEQVEKSGFIYMPLQGRLFEHRSFQSCTPMGMIHQTLAHSDLPIRATLHPNETYSDTEMEALRALEREQPRFLLSDLSMTEALRMCNFVVTENSGAGFNAVFFQKPVVLFAQIDYHHICLNCSELGAKEAFARVASHKPAYEQFLHWFWTKHAINAEADDAQTRIAERLSGLMPGIMR